MLRLHNGNLSYVHSYDGYLEPSFAILESMMPPAIAVDVDPGDPSLMERKPRDPKESIFTRDVKIYLSGFIFDDHTSFDRLLLLSTMT
ncbi:hypothetical protein DRO59_04905 [Candidatus Bathyarchaeota archaeon]|nr:MAG: hypothetical protein DRO59_04905 [Candidatus Bathyarchaeota archaeon]